MLGLMNLLNKAALVKTVPAFVVTVSLCMLSMAP